MRAITFSELRKIRDSLPNGSMHRIVDELNLDVDTVRNFFGDHNLKEGKSVGIHPEPDPDGGLIMIDDIIVLDRALRTPDELNMRKEEATEAMQAQIKDKVRIPTGKNNWDLLFIKFSKTNELWKTN